MVDLRGFFHTIKMKCLNIAFQYSHGYVGNHRYWFTSDEWDQLTHVISLAIVDVCDMRCNGCIAGMGYFDPVVPHYMSIDLINKFIDDTISMQHKWRQISLYGGEPTLHPQFIEILYAFNRLKCIIPECKFIIITNKYPYNKDEFPEYWEISSSNLKTNHNVFYISPYEVLDGNVRACSCAISCGLGITISGKYGPCGLSDVIGRIFNYSGYDSLIEIIDPDKYSDICYQFCKYCIYSVNNNDADKPVIYRYPPTFISPFFKDVKNEYDTYLHRMRNKDEVNF